MGIVSEMAKSTQATLNANKAMANATKKLRSGEGTKVSLSTKDDMKKKVISDFDPGIFLTSKEEYEEERLRDESLPEFGSYQYFVNLEKSMRPTIGSMATGSDRRGDATAGWAKQYKENPEALKRQGDAIYNEGKRLAKVFDNQEAIALKYKEVVDILDSFETPGLKFTAEGELDAKKGQKSATDKIERTKALGYAPMSSRTPEELNQLEKTVALEHEKAIAYEGYSENKDKKYDDDFFGRISGNFKLGDLGVKSNEAGYTDYAYGSKDMEAVQIYQLLMDRLQENNKATFTNDNIFEETIALSSQQVAQQYNRVKEAAPMYIASLFVPAPLRGFVSASGSVQFNFRQTAGQQYVQLISQDPNISVEDAQKLSKNVGVLSSLVEYGLDSVFDTLTWGVSGVAKKAKPLIGSSKITSAMSKIGLSDTAQKTLLNLTKNAGKFAVRTFSEGAEEGIQAMISTSANRLARKGGGSSWTDIVGEMFNFSDYTDDDWKAIGDDFKAGLIVGGFGEAVKSGVYNARNKIWNNISKNIDAKAVGKNVFSGIKNGRLTADDLENVVYQGTKSDDAETSKLANKIENAINSGKAVSEKDMGNLWMKVLQVKTDPTTFSNPESFSYELEKTVMDRDVSSDMRKRIIQSSEVIESHYGKDESKTAIKSINDETEKINKLLKESINTKTDFMDLFAANIEMVASGSNEITPNFVQQYADSIVGALKRKDFPIYKVLTGKKNKGINNEVDLAKALTSYVVDGVEPEENNLAFRKLAWEFKRTVENAADRLAGNVEEFNNHIKAASNDITLDGGEVDGVRFATENDVTTSDNDENIKPVQLVEDYNDAVDGILLVSDEDAKRFADARVAVEVLKNTPSVILDNVVEAKDLKVIINYNKLYLAVRKNGVFKGHYHNLGAEIAKKLPLFLSSPDAIIQLENGRLNLFASVETERGNNGIISIELNSTKDIGGENKDYNVIVTMFSSDDDYTRNLISGKNVTVKYEKEDLSQVNPQLYKWLATINDKSSVDTIISHDTNDVNNNDMQQSRNYSSVISAIGDTLKSDALGRMASKGVENMDDFANGVIQYYNQNGNINPYASYFKDNGASVISKIKEISEVNRNVNTEQTVSGRSNIHNENLGRTSDERSAEYGEELSGRTREAESQSRIGKNFEERRNRTQQLRDSGKTKNEELKIDNDTYTFKRIPSEYINDDAEVSSIIRQNKARGLKTVFVSVNIKGIGIDASGVKYGNTVYISYDNSEQSPTQINDHELVHFSSDSKAYADFKKSVFDKLSEKEKIRLRSEFSRRYNEAVNNYLKRIRENNPNLSGKEVVDLYNAYLDEEILANLNAGTLTLSVDVSEEIATFRKAIGGYESSDVETTPVDTESKANNSPADYKNEIDAGARFNISKNMAKKSTPEILNSGTVNSYALNRYQADVDAVLNGTYKGDDVLIMGGTPKVFTDIGLNKLPVSIDKSHVYSIAKTIAEATVEGRYRKNENYHGLGAKAVKNILSKISNPIAIVAHPDFMKKTKRDSAHKVLVLVDLQKRGNRVIAPIEVDVSKTYKNEKVDMNFVVTYFDKKSVSDILKEAVALETQNKTGFYFADKKRIEALLKESGYQLPSLLRTLNSKYIIRNIDENVNRQIDTVLKSKQFVKWFGDWQNNSEYASKVVDEDGFPKVVYHGSYSGFTIFSDGNNHSKSPDGAHFFTDDLDVAYSYTGYKNVADFSKADSGEWYSGGVYPAYLNIRNPYVVDFEGHVWSDKSVLGMDINEVVSYAKNNGYDGVIAKNIIDEGGQGDANWNEKTPIKPVTTYVVFDSTQVKSATDNIGTFDGANPDIRFNITSETPSLETQQLIEKKAEETADEELITASKLNTKEFVSMVRKNADLQKRLSNAKRQMSVSKAKSVNVGEVGKVVKEIISELQGTVKASEIGPVVKQIYDEYYLDIKKAGRVESKIQIANDKMAEKFVKIAKQIVESSQATLETDDYYALKSYLRETRIKFPDDAKSEAEFGSFRKSHMGTFNLTNDGLPIDSAYQELCDLFPHLFSKEVTDPVDQLMSIDNALSSLSPDVYNPHSENIREATEYAVYRFVSALDGISAMPDTKADKMYKKSLWDKEKAIEKTREAYEQKLDKQKKDSEEKISKLRKEVTAQKYTRYWETRLSKEEKTETIKRYRERQKVAILKSKIRSVVSDFRAKLNKTEKAGGYPKELVTTVAEVCSVLDFHTDRTGENGEPTKVSLKLDALKMEYDNLKNSIYEDFKSEHSEELSDHIARLHNLTKNKRVVDLTSYELENLYDILKEIRHRFSLATEQIGLEKSISNIEMGTEIIKTWEEKSDLIESDKYRLIQEARSAEASAKAFVLNPHRVNRMIAGYDENSAWWKLYDQLNRGVRKASKFTADANKPFDELTSGNGGNEVAFFDYRTKLYDVGIFAKNGERIKLTKSIMCELVMAWEREQGRMHLQNGGFKIPDIERYNKGYTTKALTEGGISIDGITQSHIDSIKSMLDSYDLEWIEKAKHLFNVEGKMAINQTSLQLLGREIAKAENYIRLYVDKDFVKTDIEGIKFDASLEGNGSLRATVENAKQPLILRGLHENVYEHIDFVSKYYGLAIPLRNFNKVYNIALFDEIGTVSSVKELLGKKFGSKIRNDVIERSLKDLQMPREKTSGLFSRIRGSWIGATFWGNLNSMLKQTTSYWTASSYLSETSLFKGAAEYVRHTKTTKKEISENTGTLYKREQGLSTTELGERAQRKRLAGASNKVTKAINEYAPWLRNIPEGIRPGNWLQAMDCTVAATLWEACKVEAKEKMGINESDSSYLQVVTDLYDKVVEETQSNYDVLHRPEALKDTNPLMQTVTMFQTDNLQQSGLLYDAFADMKHKSDAYKKNNNAENEKAYESSKRQFARIVKARIYSALWISMVTMVGAMALRKFLPYKDEEENDITARSVANRSLKNIAEDMFCTVVPVAGNLFLNLADTFSHGYDFLSEPAFDTVQDFLTTTSNLVKAYISDEEGSRKDEKISKAWGKFIPAAGNITGIPVNNLKNMFNGVKGYALDIVKGDFAHDISEYSSSKALYTYGDLAASIATGDVKLEEKILEYYSNNGKNITKASLTKELKSAYVELLVDEPQKGKLLEGKLIKKYGYDKDTIKEWPLSVLVDAIENGDEELEGKIRKAFPGISESKVKKEIEKRQKAKESSKISPKNE